MRKILLSCLAVFTALSLDAQLYSADYSVEGEGFPDHTTSSPPAAAPATAAGSNWTNSYTAVPSTDGSANEFSVNGGVMRIQDWGGTATWESNTIDVSAETSVIIEAIGVTVGTGVQNGGSEFFEYFYSLDGGAEVTTDIPIANSEPAGTAVSYKLPDVDVSGASNLVVGFRFNVNGGGDGYEISSYVVTTALLPVELISIAADLMNDATMVSWSTASELNNDFFVVQTRSELGEWEDIATIKGNGTTQEQMDYEFMDYRSLRGEHYYRLMQVDYDGATSYSPVVKINVKGNVEWPSLVEQQLETDINGNYFIYSISGQLIEQQNTINGLIDVSGLQQGTYILRAADGRAHRFVKQ